MTSKTAQTSHQTVAQVVLEILTYLLYIIVQFAISIVKTLTPYSLRTKKDIEGDVAVITGAGSGIGRLTALRLARLKAKVVVWDVNEEGLLQFLLYFFLISYLGVVFLFRYGRDKFIRMIIS